MLICRFCNISGFYRLLENAISLRWYVFIHWSKLVNITGLFHNDIDVWVRVSQILLMALPHCNGMCMFLGRWIFTSGGSSDAIFPGHQCLWWLPKRVAVLRKFCCNFLIFPEHLDVSAKVVQSSVEGKAVQTSSKVRPRACDTPKDMPKGGPCTIKVYSVFNHQNVCLFQSICRNFRWASCPWYLAAVMLSRPPYSLLFHFYTISK